MVDPLRFEPGDIAAGESPAKVAAALGRFALEPAASSADFDAGYRLLEAEFGAANEIERREVLEAWFAGRAPSDGIAVRYDMLLARDRDRSIAAVRDGFSAIDRRTGLVVSLMSHSLVLPPWRRSGVAALLRAAPAVFARRAARALGVEPAAIVLVAEMEPVEPDRPETRVRLLAYGRAGFRVIPPWRVPYAQPDFRLTDAPRPIPFALLVRQLGDEESRVITQARVVAILDALGRIHAPSADGASLARIRRHALAGVDPGGPPIPLLDVPDPRRVEQLFPLLRSRLLPLYPPEWRGDAPPGDPDADERRLLEEASR